MKLLNRRRRISGGLVAADAQALIAAHGDDAYEQTRTRGREERAGSVIDGNRPRGHWDRVRREIARRTGKQTGRDTATRYLEP